MSSRNIHILKGLAGIAMFLLPVGTAAQSMNPTLQGITTTLGGAFGVILVACNVGMWIVFGLLEIVLDPEFIFDLGKGDAALLTILQDIWRLSRDIVNLVFVLLLVGTAIVTVVTAKQEVIKTHFGKFVIAVLAVNFSWFIPLVVFDVGQIAAAAVYQLPSFMLEGQPCETFGEPCQRVLDVKFLEATNGIQDNQNGWHCLTDLVCYQLAPLDFNDPDRSMASSVINGLVLNYGNMINLANPSFTLNPGTTITSSGFIVFVVKEFLVLGLNLALALALIAMLIAFFIRIPVLWFTMAFMPFVAVSYVIGDKWGAGALKKIWSYFVQAAFLPAIVGIPLAIGFILLNAGMRAIQIAPKALEITIPLMAGVNNLYQLLWLIMTIGIIWVGVFTALGSQEFSKGITESINSFGKSLANIAVKAPLALPGPLPMPVGADGQKTTIFGMLKGVKDFERRISQGIPLTLGGSAKTTSEKTANAINQNPVLKSKLEGDIRVVVEEIGKNPAGAQAKFRDAFNNYKLNTSNEKDKSGVAQTEEVLIEAIGHIWPDYKKKIVESRTTPATPPPAPEQK